MCKIIVAHTSKTKPLKETRGSINLFYREIYFTYDKLTVFSDVAAPRGTLEEI
jgi:hypothetical protein